MFKIDDKVVIREGVQKFHYENTPRHSLGYVLRKLRNRRITGEVRRIDTNSGAVGVLFPHMSDFLWFKAYEVELETPRRFRRRI
jgi:hypothetical protein